MSGAQDAVANLGVCSAYVFKNYSFLMAQDNAFHVGGVFAPRTVLLSFLLTNYFLSFPPLFGQW